MPFRENIPVYGDGLNIRDWIHVDDHCSALDLVLQKGKIGEVYNIGSNNERSNIEIVKNIIEITNEIHPDLKISEDLISYVEDRKGHDRRYAIDSSKMKNDLSWKSKTDFAEGLSKTIKWYIKHKDWLKSVTNN